MSRMANDYVYKYGPCHLSQLKSLSLLSEIDRDDHLEIEVHKHAEEVKKLLKNSSVLR